MTPLPHEISPGHKHLHLRDQAPSTSGAGALPALCGGGHRLSTVTLAELQYGVAKSAFPERNQEALDAFTLPLEVIAFDAAAALAYGAIRATLERQGTPIGAMDLLIAAQARSLGITLVTNNPREFGRVEGLQIATWV